MSMAEDIFYHAALWVLLLGLGAGLLLGVLALAAPAKAVALTGALNRRYSLRRTTRPIERPIATERFIYRHHRVFGGLIGVLALLILLYMAFRFDAALVTAALSSGAERVVVGILVETLELLLWAGCLFAGAVGVIVILRPSLLKRFEARANHWLSTRRAMRGLDEEVLDTEGLFAAHPRLMGAMMSLGSLFGLIGLWLILFTGKAAG